MTDTATEIDYPGSELEVFAEAENWKAYVKRQVHPYLGERVLEVGAGLGETSRVLCTERHRVWTLLEPDRDLHETLVKRCQSGELPEVCQPRLGVLADLPDDDGYDTILYMDVLEHIADDQAEVRLAASRLNAGGFLVVLCPAHQALYTPFDKAIGHFRRYNKSMMRRLTIPPLKLSRLRYLDSVGLLASLANKWFLKQSLPTIAQIKTWDRCMVPVSRCIDWLMLYSAGKSVLSIWQKPREPETLRQPSDVDI